MLDKFSPCLYVLDPKFLFHRKFNFSLSLSSCGLFPHICLATCTVSCYMYVDIYTFDPYPAIKSVEWTPSYYKYHNQKTTVHSCWTNNINGFSTSGVVLPNWFLDNPYLYKLCQILFSIKDTTYFRFDVQPGLCQIIVRLFPVNVLSSVLPAFFPVSNNLVKFLLPRK